MTFSEIRLRHDELRLLKSARRQPIRMAQNHRLVRLDLVEKITHTQELGRMPQFTGMCRISPKGIDYLAYHRDETFRKYLTPILVSLATNALLHAAGWLWRLIR